MKTTLALALLLLVGCEPEGSASSVPSPPPPPPPPPGDYESFGTGSFDDDLLLDPSPDYSTEVDETDPYNDLRRQQAEYARDQVRWERDDLRRSVRRLRNGDWENDLPRVQREVRDMDNALWDLEMADPDNPAVQDLRYEVDKMKRETRRLDDENWRGVVPDLDRSSRNIDYGTDDLDSYDSFDDDW